MELKLLVWPQCLNGISEKVLEKACIQAAHEVLWQQILHSVIIW